MQNNTDPIETAREPSLQFDAPPPCPLKSGSCLLDRMFEHQNLHSGQLLHLYGGHRVVQQRLALLMCKAACERGERALFLNLGEPVEIEMLHRLGLSSFFNTDPALSLRQRFLQPFRFLPPGQAERTDDTLLHIQSLCMSAGYNGWRLTLVVDTLERALEPPDRRLSPTDATLGLSTLARWLGDLALLCQQTGVTVWLLHSGDEAAPHFGRGTEAPGDGWRHRVDVNERGELVRREGKRGGGRRPLAPSPLQKGVTAMLCGDVERGTTDAIAFEEIPPLFGLEVSRPGLLFTQRKFGATRFGFLVQLWQGRGRVGECERLLIEPAFRFDNNPNMWMPPLRPSSAKPLLVVPGHLGTRPGVTAQTSHTAETGEEIGSMLLGKPMLPLRK